MGDLKSRLSEETKDALRAGDKVRLSALRMLSAAVKNREVELRREVDDDEFVEVVSREVKRRREAVEAYEGADRPELADREREEQRALEAYLPERLSDEELERIVDEAIEATGATTQKDMGKVMGIVMGKAKGRVDGGAVSALVRARLSG